MEQKYNLGYDPNKTVSLKDDLTYKYHKLWKLGRNNDSTITKDGDVTSVVNAIKMEDVGDKLQFDKNNEEFNQLKISLTVLLNNKKSIKRRFARKVKSCGRPEESGRNVARMLKNTLEGLIPGCLVGGQKNKKRCITTLIKSFSFGKNDALPIKMFTKGIVSNHIKWLKNCKNKKYEFRSAMTAKLLLWLWRISKRLVASQYYVSEKQGLYNKLVYTNKSVWQQRTCQAFKSLINCGSMKYLEMKEAKEMESRRRQAKIRWLPKEGGLRPIISVRNDKLNEETILARTFINCLFQLVGEDINVIKLHKRWKEIVQQLHNNNEHPQLYFVAVDIKDAYGSIIQERLFKIVKEAVSNQLGKCNVLHFDRVYNGKKWVFTLRELHQGKLCGISHTKTVTVLSLLDIVQNYIKCQTVKWENKSYLMKRGISQAVSLSAGLCKLYLNHLDHTHLAQFSHSPNHLLRAMDDYLYITPHRDKAQTFLERMTTGFGDYNIFINEKKTQTNLLFHTELSYYGYSFNTANMEVYVKYSINVSFKNMLTFTKWQETPEKLLKQKMKSIPSFKLNKLTTDPLYTSIGSLARNVLDTACLMACCFQSVADTVYCDPEPLQLMSGVKFCAAIVVRRVFRLVESPYLTKNEIFWIVIWAFKNCIERSSLCDSSGFTACIFPYLNFQEEESKHKTRLEIRQVIYSLFDKILKCQYSNGH